MTRTVGILLGKWEIIVDKKRRKEISVWQMIPGREIVSSGAVRCGNLD